MIKIKQMKKIIVSAAFLMASAGLYAQAAGKDGKVVIEGVMTGDLKGNNIMFTYNRMGQDSTVIDKNGHYRFEFPFRDVELKMLLPDYITKQGMMYQPYGILIDGPGTYYVTSDIVKGMQASELKGPQAMLVYREFEKDQAQAYSKINQGLTDRFGQSWWQMDEKDPHFAEKEALNDSLQKVYLEPILEKLLRKHPDSYASAFVLVGSGQGIRPIARQEELYSMLSDRMKKSRQGMQFYNFIQGEKNSAIGKTVSNFVLSDPQDKPISFDQFKGKYVMLDFWASWCGPCRQSFPTMRKIYQQYKDKGFEIFSISIDENKAAWLKAVTEENNPWAQALDNQDVSHKGFAITGVPTTYLIDPQGKIVAKQVGFDDNAKGPVEEKLAAMYGELSSAAKPEDKKEGKVIPAARIQN